LARAPQQAGCADDHQHQTRRLGNQCNHLRRLGGGGGGGDSVAGRAFGIERIVDQNLVVAVDDAVVVKIAVAPAS
jgi:hypothetical protein